MRLQRSRAIFTLLRLVVPVFVMAFLCLGPLAAPGFAFMDISEEVMQEVIDPCFLAVARKARLSEPDIYKGMSDDDLLSAMKALSPEARLTMALDFSASMNLQSMTRKERFRIYELGREMCISKTAGN
ncbi:MAG: hypothetical protein F4218_10865 [Synechococcus sp. SB0677_bin_5]|nr:hypothetical protein [Synechococcus sp. SB0677_bin_5]